MSHMTDTICTVLGHGGIFLTNFNMRIVNFSCCQLTTERVGLMTLKLFKVHEVQPERHSRNDGVRKPPPSSGVKFLFKWAVSDQNHPVDVFP